MKQDFYNIVENYKKKGLIHPKLEQNIYDAIEFYCSQNEHLKEQFAKIVQKYTFENRDNLELFTEKQYQFYLCFFRGSGDYELYVRLNIDGGITGIDKEFGVIDKVFQSSNTNLAKNQQIQVDLEQFPISMFQYYEGIAYGIISRIYFTWLASVWQEVGGNNNGLTTQILENNSCSSFYLNDFSWDELSNYSEYDGKPKRIDNLFIRNLSVEEIFIRVGFKTYPVNPYKYFWRYFEKDGYFWEIACYSNQIGKRKVK